MKRAVLVCPGRGSYLRDSLGMLQNIQSPTLNRINHYRKAVGRPTPSELDGSDRFSARKHVAGSEASILTAACTLSDIDQIDLSSIEIVGACGNSMGWYTTLAAAGVLSIEDAATLIDTLGNYQAESLIGGQLVYPFTNDNWQIDAERLQLLESCITNHDELFWSIRLGSQAVLGGTEAGLSYAMEQLPTIESKGRTFPLRLPLHAAFHTPLMKSTATRAQSDLAHLQWNLPKWPIVDGHGNQWHPHHSCTQALREYTLGPQIFESFNFTLMLRTLLAETGPDIIILPGPGSNLGGAIAQVLIQYGWSQIHDRQDFLDRQMKQPVLLALARPEQRDLAVR